jgi:hypothetical protein
MPAPRSVMAFLPSMNTGAAGSSPLPGSEMPMSACFDSPGPFTTQPMTATFIVSTPLYCLAQIGICSRTWPWMRLASSWKKVEVVRPQPGQAVTSGTKERSPMVWSSSCATTTSRVRSPLGSGVSEMRIVSPMPCCNSTASAADEATMPFDPMPASVSPRCSAWSHFSAKSP